MIYTKIKKYLCAILLLSVFFPTDIGKTKAEVKTELIGSFNFDMDIADGSLVGPVIYDSTVYHNSGRSLKYRRTDPTSYNLVCKYFTASAGLKFNASCWIKTQNISKGGYASICIEAYDANNEWLNGSYLSAGITGTSDWAQLSVPDFTMPVNTAKACITLYINDNNTGTAWFDDLKIYHSRGELLYTCLLSPPYRGLTVANAIMDIKIQAKLDTIEYDVSNMKLRFEMINSDGKIVDSWESNKINDNVFALFHSSSLSPGKYTLKVDAMDRTTLEVKDTENWPITKVVDQKAMPSSYVDNYGRLIKDGKPFFMLGYYFSTLTKADIDTFADSSFNTLLPYNVLI